MVNEAQLTQQAKQAPAFTRDAHLGEPSNIGEVVGGAHSGTLHNGHCHLPLLISAVLKKF